MNKLDVENLIKKASSDFISRMLVISELDIKAQSYWEHECYGIVVPDDSLQMYMERVFNDFTECDCVYVNRNSGNEAFRDLLHSHTSSICGNMLSTLIQTGSSTCISTLTYRQKEIQQMTQTHKGMKIISCLYSGNTIKCKI